MFRDGDSLNTQPENTRRHFLSAPWTSVWTKAPVSFSGSHGAVASQARSRTMMSPRRIACPGFIVRSRSMPLRLLSTPMTATRSAMGVAARTPGTTGALRRDGAAVAPASSAASAWLPPEAAGGSAAGGGTTASFCNASAACQAPRLSSPAIAVAASARFTGWFRPARGRYPGPGRPRFHRPRLRHGPCRSRTGRSSPSDRSRPAYRRSCRRS